MVDNTNKFKTVACNFTEPKTDIEWINFALSYLIEFYVIHKNKTGFQHKSENQITDKIYFWLKTDKKNIKFNRKMTVNSQPKTDNQEVEGYYDLKFESPLWQAGQKHFAIENKILEDNSESYKEYIYKPIAKSQRKYGNGGMYRFLSNKYAQDQPYGGMLAFIKKGNIQDIKSNLTDKIKDIKIPNENNFYGEVINCDLLDFKIQNFDNSFQSNHKRNDGTKIHLIHLLFSFNEE